MYQLPAAIPDELLRATGLQRAWLHTAAIQQFSGWLSKNCAENPFGGDFELKILCMCGFSAQFLDNQPVATAVRGNLPLPIFISIFILRTCMRGVVHSSALALCTPVLALSIAAFTRGFQLTSGRVGFE